MSNTKDKARLEALIKFQLDMDDHGLNIFGLRSQESHVDELELQEDQMALEESTSKIYSSDK